MKVDFDKLDRAFNPNCIAVVGDQAQMDFPWLQAESTFKGKLYSVQTNPKTIGAINALGVQNYTNLLDIPDPIDLAIVSVPRTAAQAVLEDCIHKEVAAAHFFTAGFSETGTEEGIRFERMLVERAKQANFHLIGPNCMGIFNPKLGVRQVRWQYVDSAGSLGFISQSGTYAMEFSVEAHFQGVDIAKSVSFGNGVVLDSTDYLEYLGSDADIQAIGMYLEGVKDVKRFLSVLRGVSARKPVVILKGGRTEAGERAIASHTASLAMSRLIWDTAMKQSGAITVTSVQELIDTLKALLYLPTIRGNRIALVGAPGGPSVSITDTFVEAGLEVPPLTRDSYSQLETFFTLIGGSYRNPIDLGAANEDQMTRIMEVVGRDANIDNLVWVLSPVTGQFRSQYIESDISSLVDVKKKIVKPMLALIPYLSSPEYMQQTRNIIQKLKEGRIPVFPSAEMGAQALRNVLDYHSLAQHRGNTDLSGV